MQLISELLKKYEWPSVDSITYGNGKMVLFGINSIDKNNLQIVVKHETMLDNFLEANPEDISSFDIFSTTKFNDYTVHVGDGSYEGDGIIYITKSDSTLLWFAFFEDIGPFIKVSFDTEGFVHAINDYGTVWKMEILNPLNITRLNEIN